MASSNGKEIFADGGLFVTIEAARSGDIYVSNLCIQGFGNTYQSLTATAEVSSEALLQIRTPDSAALRHHSSALVVL
jgi:methylaspartate ammonia-lyase